MARRPPDRPPPLRQLGPGPGRFGGMARRWVARHPASPLTLGAQRGVHWLTAVLHTENHDPVTNGERRVLDCLGDSTACILDVGAHDGRWASLAVAACPAARVHCFEIASPVRDRLRARVAGQPGILVADAGLLDFDGTVPVKYYAEDTEVSSIVDYPHRSVAAWRQERVRTGDHYLASAGIGAVDLLKVDAEGADLRVLNGFARAFSAGRITAVQFEYGFAGVLTGALLYRFYAFFEPLGFTVGKVRPDRVDFRPFQLTDERFFGPNFLAVRRDHPDLVGRLAGSRR